MDIRATALIPTHDHGPTLLRAARSVLAQTVRELELLIIGDGASPAGRQIAEELQRADARVRFFDHPKGPRLGERYRHDALRDARGPIVCYLSDDDLWLPDHVETMERLLVDGDFAHALSVKVELDGSLNVGNDLDFRVPGVREAMAAGTLGGTGLSCMAHTMDFYRRLPVGWDATPPGVASDTHMSRKLVAPPDCRPISGTRPTVLRFLATPRRSWSPEQRAAELDCWVERAANPGWLAELPFAALDSVVRADATKRFKLDVERRKRRERNALIEELTRIVQELRARVTELTAEADHATEALVRKTAECERLLNEQAQLRAHVNDAAVANKRSSRELSRRAVDHNRLVAERDRLAAECRHVSQSNKRLAEKLSRARAQCRALLAEREI